MEDEAAPLTCALLVALRLISRHALAASARVVPRPVRLAQVGRAVLDGSVRHAAALLLHDGRELGPGRRVREDGERHGDGLAQHVVDADGQQRRARPLVVEREVDAASRDGHAAHLNVNNRVVDVLERAVGRHHVGVVVRVRVPRRHHGVGEVGLGLVVVEFEGLAALVQVLGVRVQLTRAHREAHLHVQPVRVAARDVRRPNPIVHVVQVDVTHGVDPHRLPRVLLRQTPLPPLQRENDAKITIMRGSPINEERNAPMFVLQKSSESKVEFDRLVRQIGFH